MTTSRGRRTWLTRFAAVALVLTVAGRARSGENAPAAGDVTNVTLVRTLDRHPGAADLWEPYIALWTGKHLVVAFGAGIPDKTDMGDILCCTSKDEGKTWAEPVAYAVWDSGTEKAHRTSIRFGELSLKRGVGALEAKSGA